MHRSRKSLKPSCSICLSMAVHSDYVEEQDHKKPFSAVLDRSEPLVFLQKVFEFVARESDLFKSNSDVSAVFKMIRSRMEESRKNAAVQLNQTKPEQQAKGIFLSFFVFFLAFIVEL